MRRVEMNFKQVHNKMFNSLSVHIIMTHDYILSTIIFSKLRYDNDDWVLVVCGEGLGEHGHEGLGVCRHVEVHVLHARGLHDRHQLPPRRVIRHHLRGHLPAHLGLPEVTHIVVNISCFPDKK